MCIFLFYEIILDYCKILWYFLICIFENCEIYYFYNKLFKCMFLDEF